MHQLEMNNMWKEVMSKKDDSPTAFIQPAWVKCFVRFPSSNVPFFNEMKSRTNNYCQMMVQTTFC